MDDLSDSRGRYRNLSDQPLTASDHPVGESTLPASSSSMLPERSRPSWLTARPSIASASRSCGRAGEDEAMRPSFVSQASLPLPQRVKSPDTALDDVWRWHSSPNLLDRDGQDRFGRPVTKFTAKGYTWLYGVPQGNKQKDTVREDEAPFRLLSRFGHGSHHQQHKLRIHRIHHLSYLYELYFRDMFHTLVNLKLRHLLVLFVFVYMIAFSTLAGGFWWISDRCGLGVNNFMEAFSFSVETWLTIGYGVDGRPGPYFRNCPAAVALITLQGLAGLLMNALLVGLVMVSISSGAFRGCTLLFSEKAVIRDVGGRLYLMMQVCEMRSSQLLECHVRAYVIRRPLSSQEVSVDSPQAFELRLVRPDDSNGALILPAIPSVIVHEIDQCSPLAPLPKYGADDAFAVRHWTRPPVRISDADVGNRDAVWCRTCGEQFASPDMLEAHIAYQTEQDALAGATVRAHHPETSSPPEPKPGEWRKSVVDFLDKEWFEILVVIEGVDTMTAATVQARHSYLAEDIAWDHTFAPIFSLNPRKGAVIDFTRMHDLVEAPPQPL